MQRLSAPLSTPKIGLGQHDTPTEVLAAVTPWRAALSLSFSLSLPLFFSLFCFVSLSLSGMGFLGFRAAAANQSSKRMTATSRLARAVHAWGAEEGCYKRRD